MMAGGFRHRDVQANGIRLHFVELGEGPLVLLCHGFPESWYSWRHQIRALADAGFRVVAPDMRGYGRTEAPEPIASYTLLHLVGDMVGLLDALGAAEAVVAGHDWGAPVAWHCALLRPDRFRAVAALSVPFMPRPPAPPTTLMPQTEDAVFYQLYFQQPGVAEAELERDVPASIRSILCANSGDGPLREHGLPPPGQIGLVPRKGGLTAARMAMAGQTLPPWLTEEDVAFYAGEFARTGFRGGLNWYRNIDRNWELLAPFAGMQVKVPALYIYGDLDLVLAFRGVPDVVANLSRLVPNLRETIRLPGCGHWTQQERAQEVSRAMIGFLRRLG